MKIWVDNSVDNTHTYTPANDNRKQSKIKYDYEVNVCKDLQNNTVVKKKT